MVESSAPVRSARNSDSQAIADIYNESILARDSTMDTVPMSAEEIEQLLTGLDEREQLFVLESRGLVRGWGIVKKYSDRPGYRVACETSVYVFRSDTGQGFGSRLQRRLMEHCLSVGFHHIVVKIWADNESSIAFHRKFGFKIVGIQHEIGRVDGQWRDIAIMECVLPDGPVPNS
jgi:L-amino acid N-acyltransferase YncA